MAKLILYFEPPIPQRYVDSNLLHLQKVLTMLYKVFIKSHVTLSSTLYFPHCGLNELLTRNKANKLSFYNANKAFRSLSGSRLFLFLLYKVSPLFDLFPGLSMRLVRQLTTMYAGYLSWALRQPVSRLVLLYLLYDWQR